ncbi:hypothetical protein KA082_02980 [Candidatus Woesebacteria bacterium]|nr:hypothetical protein [Candidatus Woesebacteria bacterium]
MSKIPETNTVCTDWESKCRGNTNSKHSLARLVAESLTETYQPFLVSGQTERIAPILEIVPPREMKRNDLARKGTLTFSQMMCADAGTLTKNTKQATFHRSPHELILGLVTEAASPHTNERMQSNDIQMAAQIMYWLLDNREEIIRWTDEYPSEKREEIAQLLGDTYRQALEVFAFVLQIPLSELLADPRLKSYFLTGYGEEAECAVDGTCRGSQSARYFHGHFSLQDFLNLVTHKKLGVVTNHELLKQLNPLNVVFMKECGTSFAQLVQQIIGQLGQPDVVVTPATSHVADLEKKELLANDHIVITFAKPLPLAELFNLMFSLYAKIEDIHKFFFILKKDSLSYEHLSWYNENFVDDTVKMEAETQKLDSQSLITIWKFVKKLRPTRTILEQAVQESGLQKDVESMRYLKMKLLRMNKVAKFLLPNTITATDTEASVKEKLEKHLDTVAQFRFAKILLGSLSIPLRPVYLKMLQDVSKPMKFNGANLTRTISGVAAAHFSSITNIGEYSINENGELCVSSFTLTPTIGGELGGAESHTGAVIRRAEGR